MTTLIWVTIGSDNDLLPDDTKPLPETMLANTQWGIVAFTWEQYTASTQATILYNEFESYAFEITATSPRANELKAMVGFLNWYPIIIGILIYWQPMFEWWNNDLNKMIVSQHGFLCGISIWRYKWLPYLYNGNTLIYGKMVLILK